MDTVEMKRIHKIYPDDTYALSDVNFSVHDGEIHGLIGENGAGKTTLMRILYGAIQPSKGQIFINGSEESLHDPSYAIKLGIGMVHQKFTLINSFTVTENVILGAEPDKGVLLDDRYNQEIVQKLSDQTGLYVTPNAVVDSLPIGVKQRVEILKMLYRGAKLLILDEPTSVLTPTEVHDFFHILRRLKTQGSTIIFVTHKLREVLEICDRITVLRGGKVVGVLEINESTPQILARMMVGRDVIFDLAKEKAKPGKRLLEVNDLTVRNDDRAIAVDNLSFELRAGEILGIAGVEGNGQTELVEVLTGLRGIESGEIMMMGQPVSELTSKAIRHLGVAHIPADKDMGLIADLNIEENLILGFQTDQSYSNGIIMDFDAISQFADQAIIEYNIKTPSVKSRVRYLSGGNQQRVVVARELSHHPKIIVAAQPTRGLDVASTEYVRTTLLQMSREGKGILLITTDLDEALQLSDRLAIIYNGSFIDIVDPTRVTEEQLGLMMGGHRVKE